MKNVPVRFGSECLLLDIPIIPTNDFQLLLASDVLDYGLEKCIIDFHNMELVFKKRDSDLNESLPIHLLPNNKVLQTYTSKDTNVSSNLSKDSPVWPEIAHLPT